MSPVIGLVTIGLVHLFFYALYHIIRTAFFSKLLKIPGLPFGPIYGNVRESLQGEAMDTSVRWAKKYGGIVRFYRIFGREAVMLADPNAIRHVMVTHSTNYLRPTNLIEFVSDGLFALEGPIHRSERKLLNPSLNLSAVKSFMPLFQRKATELTDKIRELCTSESACIDMQHYVKAATMDVIGLAAFHYDLGAIHNPHSDAVSSLDLLISSQQRSLLSNLPYHRYLPTAANKAFSKAANIVDRLCYDIINKSRQCPPKESTIISRLLSACYEDGKTGLTDKALRDHILTFMIAGHETSSLTLTWMLYELAKNPDKQEKLCLELSAISFDTFTMDDLEQLTYLDACIKETMRLYPAAPSVTRQAKNDDVLCGYHIPAGTSVIVHLGTMMRTSVEDGDKFIPERFLSEDTAIKWLPFGIGPHTCIGNKFALAEMKVLAVHLAKAFQFCCVKDLVIKRKYRLVLRPIPNVQLLVTER